MKNYTMLLAEYITKLEYNSIPVEVINKTKELFIDWLGCCFAGSKSEVTSLIKNVSKYIGEGKGASIIGSNQEASPFVAALVNGASSHAVELDDVHNGSIFHPGATVIPAAFAVAQDKKLSGKELIVSIIAGYEISIRLGECLGLSHYHYFHTTATAGVIGAAAAASYLLRQSVEKVVSSIGNAGTLAGGLWQFLEDEAMSKQLHTGRAAADGLLSAYLADAGLLGPHRILEGERGMCKAMSVEPDWSKLDCNLDNNSYKVTEVSLKPYACCRHIHPAIDGVLSLINLNAIQVDDIKQIKIYIYTNGYELLHNVQPNTPYTAKFCIPYCIAHAVLSGEVKPNMFEPAVLFDNSIREFMKKVDIYPSQEMDALYPATRASKVEIITKSNESFHTTIYKPKGDPENPLDIGELKEKFVSLTKGILKESEACEIFERCLRLEEFDSVSDLLLNTSNTHLGVTS